MIDRLKRAWAWVVENWKWVLFPVGILLAVGSFFTAQALLSQYAEPPEGLNPKTRDALRKLRAAELVHDQKVAELEALHLERLRDLSDEQQKELEGLRDKPLEEVVAWFDLL